MILKDLMRRRSSLGVRRAIWQLRQEWAMSRQHRKGVRRAGKYAGAKSLKLNIGCGPNLKPGWVNIDMANGADLQLDMREAIPLPDASAQMIYSEHFFEHLDYPTDTSRFLRESFRVLEPGGVFSVVVPDTTWPLRDYCGGDGAYFETANERQWHPPWCRTRMDHINYHFRQDGDHRFAWDFETMELALRDVGFAEIKQRAYRPNLDTESRALGSLYVDARKPH